MSLPNESTSATYGAPFADATAVEDPTTDQSAAQANQFMADCAAATHTVTRAYVAFMGNATLPTISEHNSNWGNANAVVPVASRTGVGDYTFTWPATVTAEDGTTIALNLKRVQGLTFEGPLRGFWTATIPTANTVRLKLFDTTNAASDFVGQTFSVWVR